MIFDGDVLRPILRDMAARRRHLEAEATARQQEIYQKIPRIREIDSELRTTPLAIVRNAFSQQKDASSQLSAIREHNLALQAERAELLVAAGYAYDELEVHYHCPHCRDTGYLSASEPCACLREAYRDAQMKALAGSVAVGAETFAAFDVELYSKERTGSAPSPYEQMCQIYDYCVEYTKHFGSSVGNLFFSGGTGLGKTLLASCIALEVAGGGASVVYDNAFHVLSVFEEKKFSRDSGAEHDPTQKYNAADLLVIDDLGCEMITAFTTAVLYHLINTRLMAGKKTILVSHLTMDELSKKYTAQIASRIRGDYVWLAFCGQDIRTVLRK